MIETNLTESVFIKEQDGYVDVLVFDNLVDIQRAWVASVPDVDFGFIKAEFSIGLRPTLTDGLRYAFPVEEYHSGQAGYSILCNEAVSGNSGWIAVGDYLSSHGINAELS